MAAVEICCLMLGAFHSLVFLVYLLVKFSCKCHHVLQGQNYEGSFDADVRFGMLMMYCEQTMTQPIWPSL